MNSPKAFGELKRRKNEEKVFFFTKSDQILRVGS